MTQSQGCSDRLIIHLKYHNRADQEILFMRWRKTTCSQKFIWTVPKCMISKDPSKQNWNTVVSICRTIILKKIHHVHHIFFTFTIFWSSFFDFQHHKINTTSIEDLNGDPSGHLRWCCFRFHSSWRGNQPQVSYHEIWYVMIDKIVTNRNSTFTHHFLHNKANSNNLRLSTTLYLGGPPPGKRGLCF